jgi:hypothetical protein
MEYQQKKAEEEMQKQQYEMEKNQYEMQLKMTKEMEKFQGASFSGLSQPTFLTPGAMQTQLPGAAQ